LDRCENKPGCRDLGQTTNDDLVTNFKEENQRQTQLVHTI